MYTVNEMVEHCNWDIGDVSSKSLYACYDSGHKDIVYCISEVHIDDIRPSYHVVVIRIIDDFIDTFDVKCFGTFEEAKVLLDMMTYTDYVVLLNNRKGFNYEK